MKKCVFCDTPIPESWIYCNNLICRNENILRCLDSCSMQEFLTFCRENERQVCQSLRVDYDPYGWDNDWELIYFIRSHFLNQVQQQRFDQNPYIKRGFEKTFHGTEEQEEF